jgi:hypothetical protein
LAISGVAEFERLHKRLRRLGRAGMVLLSVTVLAMASARYL